MGSGWLLRVLRQLSMILLLVVGCWNKSTKPNDVPTNSLTRLGPPLALILSTVGMEMDCYGPYLAYFRMHLVQQIPLSSLRVMRVWTTPLLSFVGYRWLSISREEVHDSSGVQGLGGMEFFIGTIFLRLPWLSIPNFCGFTSAILVILDIIREISSLSLATSLVQEHLRNKNTRRIIYLMWYS